MTEINRVCISSGHSLKVRGASGMLDEVDEARRVVEHVADELGAMGVEVMIFHDDTSQRQGRTWKPSSLSTTNRNATSTSQFISMPMSRRRIRWAPNAFI